MALVVQDLDGMGLFLSGRAGSASGQKITIIPNEHGRVSRLLLRLSRWQADAVKTTELLSFTVSARLPVSGARTS
jgi:hypothetical protein